MNECVYQCSFHIVTSLHGNEKHKFSLTLTAVKDEVLPLLN
jgi:hypothetical protein